MGPRERLWGVLKETGLSDTISERRGVRDKKSRDRLGEATIVVIGRIARVNPER